MSVKLEAPYPAMFVTTYLPDPTFGDSQAVGGEVRVKRKMSGAKRTYIVTKGDRRTLIFRFEVGREKALELRAFIRAFKSEQVRLTDHNGAVWLGCFTVNPFEFEALRRSMNSPGNIKQSIQIEFQGELQ